MAALRQQSLLEINEFLVLDFVRQRGETTRVEISRQLRLSPASVSRMVSTLLSRNAVIERPGKASRGGRPSMTIAFNHRAGAVLALDLGATKCHGALADLSGEIVADHHVQTADHPSHYDALVAVWREAAASAAALGLPIQAAAVGVPGVVDPDSGLIVRAPNVGWEGFDLKSRLDQEFTVPYLVENDVNLVATAESWKGGAQGVQDFAVLSIGTGLGGALVSEGHLVTGRHNAAGEIATMVLSTAQLAERRVGGLGGLEIVVSGPAIAARAHGLIREDPQGSTLGLASTPKEIIAAAAGGDRLSLIVVEELLDALAVAAIAICAVSDPELVLLDGAVGRALEPFLGGLRERMDRHIAQPPRLEIARIGTESTLIGGVGAALRLLRNAAVPDGLPNGRTASDARRLAPDSLWYLARRSRNICKEATPVSNLATGRGPLGRRVHDQGSRDRAA